MKSDCDPESRVALEQWSHKLLTCGQWSHKLFEKPPILKEGRKEIYAPWIELLRIVDKLSFATSETGLVACPKTIVT